MVGGSKMRMLLRPRIVLVAAVCAGVLGCIGSAGLAATRANAAFTVSSSIANGATLSGSLAWTASAGGATVSKVEFLIDGTTKWTENYAPYWFNGDNNLLDTTQLSNGTHTLGVKAYATDGRTASTQVTVTVNNASPPPPPPSDGMPVGDIPGWHQIFADDFNTSVPLGSFPAAVSSKWGAYADGWKDTSGLGTYMPSRVVSIHDGLMDLFIHTENGKHLVSAPIPKLPGAVGSGGGLKYGRYAIRFRSDPVPAYKLVFLLWPDSGVWPRDGEIDAPEGGLGTAFCFFMHHQGATAANDQDASCINNTTFGTWHTFVVEWLPSRVSFLMDGATIMTSTSRIPNTPLHWVLQVETDGNAASVPDTAAGHVTIAWVTAYTPA